MARLVLEWGKPRRPSRSKDSPLPRESKLTKRDRQGGQAVPGWGEYFAKIYLLRPKIKSSKQLTTLLGGDLT